MLRHMVRTVGSFKKDYCVFPRLSYNPSECLAAQCPNLHAENSCAGFAASCVACSSARIGPMSLVYQVGAKD